MVFTEFNSVSIFLYFFPSFNKLTSHFSDIGNLCTQIGLEWHLLGIHLGYSSVQMEQLRTAHPDNIYQCAFELISKWTSILEEHNVDTRNLLADSLRDVGRADLADDLMVASPRLSGYSETKYFSKQFSSDLVDELDGLSLGNLLFND